jgi:hypothetical protein
MTDATTRLTKDDIDAVWALLIASAPSLDSVGALRVEGALTGVVMHMLQARLALTMRTGADFVPVSKQWRDMATGLVRASECAAQFAQPWAKAAAEQPPALHTPAQTDPQALDASAPDAGLQQ